MNIKGLINRNIHYFRRFYRLVAAAVLVTVAVIVGSVVVGDSVRTTLVKRVDERLGNTQTVILSRNSFMSDEILHAPLFEGAARGFIVTDGFISRDGRLIPVSVWGTDDMAVSPGAAKINPALTRELGGDAASDIVLRLPATGLVPSGSLFVTGNYTTSLRLSSGGIADASEGGNVSIKNEQIIPLNIFVNRSELAEALETEGKINLILTDREIVEADLNEAWNYSVSGLSADRHESFTEITSDRIFLQKEATRAILRSNPDANRLFSYLANSMRLGERSIPYSFVTALDRFQDESLQKDDIILSDYAARRLHAKQGDTIELSYFTSHDLKTLSTGTVKLRVKHVVPLSVLQDDKTLSADFPGLSDAVRCSDWDSDLPIDMELITDEDESYWELYRSTPKAIVAYDAVCSDWSNAYGNATAVRVSGSEADLSALQPEMFGIQMIHPRETGLYAARNGVDFSGLFLALGFFIVVSAMLLMVVPISEMIVRRRDEIALMRAIGFTRKRIIRILWRESAPVVLVFSVAGVIGGLLYTGIIIWLLGNVWKGATHTEGFSVYPDMVTVLIGLGAGIAISMLILRGSIASGLKDKNRNLPHKRLSLRRKKTGTILATIIAAAVIVINIFLLHSVILFVVVGVILLGTAALWGDYIVCSNGSASSGGMRSGKMVWSSLLANRKQAMLSFFALATGVFIVFSVGLNRKGFADSSQIRTGTGGYSLWCESSVPVYHNMATRAGREKLSLTGLPADARILQCLRYGADDASCLNLNKVTSPTVLGVDMDALAGSDFQVERSLFSSDRSDVFEQMKGKTGDVYPSLVDATVLTWSLGMSLGDTLHYEGDRGWSVAIRLAGTLSNSIFQGHILIDRGNFSEIWEETAGSEVFLLKVDEDETEGVKTLLSQALNEYGVRVSTTGDRLRQFNTVTDTYLTIFLTLGGIGLLLGIMSFVIVVRKNLAMRRREIDLYRTLGFTDRRIAQTMDRENLIVPLYAIATGVLSALAGVSAGFANAGIWIWLLALLFTVLFAGCLIFFVRKYVRKVLEIT